MGFQLVPKSVTLNDLEGSDVTGAVTDGVTAFLPQK